MLVVATPGFERFFFETGEPAAALTVPPPSVTAPPDLDALVAALADHGVEVLAPPPVPMEAWRA